MENGMMRESDSRAQICLRDQARNSILFPDFECQPGRIGQGRELFPTPLAGDYRSGTLDRLLRRGKQKNLNDFVKLFPSPCVQDYKHRGPRSRQQGLTDVVRSWPAPAARDYKDGSKSSCANVPVKGLLGRAVHEGGAAEGQLSAVWTEALMGYPPDWTDIEKECVPENCFPGSWLDGTWEAGIPRVIKNQKYRRHRIEALGNSIVPQIPYVLFMAKEFDRWRKE
jgi:hypothetical protein